MKSFFISYNKADKKWASWVASTLEQDNRYTTIYQERDFRPGENFVLRMQEAMRDSERTIAVLSNHYLAALFTQSEWTSAFQKDPTGTQRALIPVRVEPCELPPPFNVLIYCDLVDLDEESAERALLSAVSPEVVPSTERPAFPGKPKEPPADRRAFTPEMVRGVVGSSEAAGARIDDIVAMLTEEHGNRHAARRLLDTLQTAYVTFQAQAEVRDALHAMMLKRFPGSASLQYEDFFSQHFAEMTDEERTLHDTMRGYTVHALHEYNKQALGLVRDHPGLVKQVPKLADLEHHLDVWMDKYENTFLRSPHMSLCYVGVHERVPFPTGIEAELRAYLGATVGSPYS